MAEWWPRAHNSWSYGPLIGFQILPFLKIFLTDFSGTMKARKLKGTIKSRKLKVHINMDNDWIYQIYPNRGLGSITDGVISLGRFSKN